MAIWRYGAGGRGYGRRRCPRLGSAITRMTPAEIPWTVQYDEVVLVLEHHPDRTCADLKRFTKTLPHRFSRNAVPRSIFARVPPLADVSGQRRNALGRVAICHFAFRYTHRPCLSWWSPTNSRPFAFPISYAPKRARPCPCPATPRSPGSHRPALMPAGFGVVHI